MNISKHVTIAFAIRISLVFFGKFQDAHFVVKYTDIDYSVYSDAARFVWNGTSPYQRQTYRYSPILAFLLTPNTFLHESFGKLLFVVLDICTGYLIHKILQTYLVSQKYSQLCSFLWLYNPICAVVSTRGSSDSINTVLMLLCIQLLLKNHHVLLGLTFGFVVHFRLYPCIYSFAFYSSLTDFPLEPLKPMAKLWLIISPNRKKFILVVFTIIGFVLPTAVSYYRYGWPFIEEAFLYHLYRKDIKHNFSPYFYFMYLMEQSSIPLKNVLMMVPFGIQLTLLLVVTWVFCTRESLPIALFLQTYMFVTFNKVCTSQYFLWYLSFFPLNVALLRLKLFSFVGIIILWFFGQAIWLLPAYHLEFQGANTFLLLWASGLTMFSINVYLIYSFCKTVPVRGYCRSSKKNI